MPPDNFAEVFKKLTGSPPFPWQKTLYYRMIGGDFPSTASLPTGLGKTSIIAVWLCALVTASDPTAEAIPRRLVYVVNRRTVVDQTTAEVERLREALELQELTEMREVLSNLCALPLPAGSPPLAVSTLRGQFADNGEWCADPTRPAVIVGTVDMIGSGLLFSRYTRGFKTRPLHAGLLGQDALLVHDEAHLEPAFQTLLETIVAAQNAAKDLRPLRVIALTATNRSGSDAKPFGLDENPDDKDSDDPIVSKRFNARKELSLAPLDKDEKVDAKLVEIAKARREGRAVLIFARSVETATKVATELDKGAHKRKVALLTGTMRGKERDDLVAKNPVFQRFLAPKDRAKKVEPEPGTVFLVATSAGEVGVNLSADDLVCDLSTYESMAQRFGRVNRFGDLEDSKVIVVHETNFDSKKPVEAARERTLALLKRLGDSASPAALNKLPANARAAAFSPQPTLRFATDVQFDAWALTSIREPIAARPRVAPYLHGEAEWQPAETYLAWRADADFLHIDDPESFLDEFPLKPAELLRDSTARIVKTLAALLKNRTADSGPLPDAWLIKANGAVKRFSLFDFKKDSAEAVLAESTLILPASLGGLDEKGIFSASANEPAADCSGIERRESDSREEADFCVDISDEDADEPRYMLWFAPVAELSVSRKKATATQETLAAHTKAVSANAEAIAGKLFPDTATTGEPNLRRCLIAAARLHDLGKNRRQWQRNLGNVGYDPAKPETILAKAVGTAPARNVSEHYRHEFGSLLDAAKDPAFTSLTATEREIALHLVAAHHGRARPYFPANEAIDYSGNIAAEISTAAEIPLRFARLQKRFGRWGLAWLESLLRAADYAASAGIVAQSTSSDSDCSTIPPEVVNVSTRAAPTPSATLALNPANPGHYFACCGLFELAARLSPDALAWFERTDSGFRFHLANTPPLVDLFKEITTAEVTAESVEPDQTEETETDDSANNEGESEKEASAPPLCIKGQFSLRLDWWTTASLDTSALKVWAGSMKVLRIAVSMQQAIQKILEAFPQDAERILFHTCFAVDPRKLKKEQEKVTTRFEADLKKAQEKRNQALKKANAKKTGPELEKEKGKIEAKYCEDYAKAKNKQTVGLLKAEAEAKAEPFYFDANRGPNSDARDVGFSPNDLKSNGLKLRTLAAPAAEFLTLVGLQRAIPQPAGDRLFDYRLWHQPIPISLLAAAINGCTEPRPSQAFRFESWFRTSQRKHKAFLPAKPL